MIIPQDLIFDFVLCPCSVLGYALPSTENISVKKRQEREFGQSSSRIISNYWTRLSKISWFVSGELFPIFISDRRFGAVWTNKRVFLETENTQALLFINKGTCKTPIAMSWLREIFCLSVRHNFHLLERHFPCWYNRQADRLSRLIQSASFSNYGSFSHS